MLRLIVLVGALGWASTAIAAAAGAPAKPIPAGAAPGVDEPSVTTASFADWTLRCQRTGAAEHAVRFCEVGSVLRAPGQSGPVAQVAIGRLIRGESLRLTALLPPNVSFPSTVGIRVGDKDAALDLEWRRCLPGACVAEAQISDQILSRLRDAAEPIHLTFVDAAGRTLTVPLSLNGLTPALTALSKEQH